MRIVLRICEFISIVLLICCSQVRTELREMSPEELATFLDDFNHIIFEMVSSNDVNEKKGGILAIGMFNLRTNSYSNEPN